MTSMIRSFADAGTADLFEGRTTKAARAFPAALHRLIVRKLDRLNAAAGLQDLVDPPGNRLHALRGSLPGRYSIRVNDQYRITFRFEQGHAHDVRCEDYH